ncbi:KR domain-containing protein [Nonomuraea turkmeniaca]|uniref:KR domain-containing protein n=1 Tax=Nonomuraea turkmeniaca TaxID=103838 RepID=A0A5S4FZX0_9ACTN|nr:beta-ketoacyl synthase N-terminal-like domain-containing protein [Nonomuraea turkmeniaca]TMR17527.1 KR domain-containing protein [Nonomuraea turkmeniaca]
MSVTGLIAQEPVAVVGCGVVAPGANNAEELWTVLNNPEPQHRPPCRFDATPLYSPDPNEEDRTFGVNGGYITTFRPHPLLIAEIERGWWHQSDSEPLWLRHTLLQALDTTTVSANARTGCYVATWLGASSAVEDTVLAATLPRQMAARLATDTTVCAMAEHRLRNILRKRYPYAAPTPRMMLPDMLVRRAIAGLLPESTDWLTVSAACASSLYSIDLGIHALLTGDCDIAFCGAVSGMGRLMAISAAKFDGMSKSGDLRAFDAAADGTLFGEGATMLALKRMDRVRVDGDPVLGYLTGSGLATDGRGKSMAAPNPTGQRRALQRAWEAGGVSGDDIDWMVAHGTGTLAGDQVEIEVLSEVAPATGVVCTSNKSLLGHAAWSAGGLSVIHALLALRHKQIPAQQRFTHPHPALNGSPVRVPTTPVPWPDGAERPRIADVGSLGVGGANAHLLVQDRPTASQSANRHTGTAAETADSPVLVAWSAHLPDAAGTEQIRHWFATGEKHPARSFGSRYPESPIAATRLPGVVTRVIDRTHRMALDVAYRFVTEHGELWENLRERTGVITAQTGPTRTWLDATIRACAPDLEHALPLEGKDRAALHAVLGEIRARQSITDEMLAGSVPTLAAYRVTNRWDLHGASMGIDAGPGSSYAALHMACRYLTRGVLDLALVVCMNEGSSPDVTDFTGHDHTRLAEGAFLLALTRESLARTEGWPVLARITTSTCPDSPNCHTLGDLDSEAGDYLGAQGAVDVLRAVHRGGHHELACPDPGIRITLAPPDPGPPASEPSRKETSRWALTLRRADPAPGRGQESQHHIPHRGVVLVSSATLARELASAVHAADAIMFSTDPDTAPQHATIVPEIPDEVSLAPVLAPLDQLQPRVRVIGSVREHVGRWPQETPTLTRLLELTLLTLKRFGARLSHGDVAALLFDPLTDFQVHPETAQFNGFLRSLSWEIPPEKVFAVVTDAAPAHGLAELAREATALRNCQIVYYRNGLRHIEQYVPLPEPHKRSAQPARTMNDPMVVVAVGGARGITAVALKALARQEHAHLWLLGRTDPAAAPLDILHAAEEDNGALRAKFITAGRRHNPTATVADLNQRFEAHWRAREVNANLERLRALCGDDHVHYRTCDVTDTETLNRVAAEITSTHPHIDLLLHAAFHQHSAHYDHKTLKAFRAVLGTKVNGYRNLKAAFASVPPRRWCNFGSSIVLFGLAGETDYAAGSEFLAAAARYDARLLGVDTTTIGWGLWEEAGSVTAPQDRDRLADTGVKHGVDNDEGAALFLSEIARPHPTEPSPVYTTSDDRTLAQHRNPGMFSPNPNQPLRSGLLGEPVEQRQDHARWQWGPDPEADRYLLEHLVLGRPVLPGACIVAMAVEAAQRLLPHTTVTGLRDIRFKEFVWVDPRQSGPTKYRVVADLIERGKISRVRVSVLSDVTTQSGRVLRANREHASLDVITGPPLPPPHQMPIASLGTRRIADPCCQSGSPIHLTGVFRCCTDNRAGHGYGTSRFQACIAPGESLGRSPVPILLLDALGRSTCFPAPEADQAEIGAVSGIDSIDFFFHGSDADLARAYPEGIQLHGEFGRSIYTATTSNGQVITRITGLVDHPFGSVVAIPLPDDDHHGSKP